MKKLLLEDANHHDTHNQLNKNNESQSTGAERSQNEQIAETSHNHTNNDNQSEPCTLSVGTQTDNVLWPNSSSPIKGKEPTHLTVLENLTSLQKEIDLSNTPNDIKRTKEPLIFSKLDFSSPKTDTDTSYIDPDDTDYKPSTIESSYNEEKVDTLNDEKFVVYEGLLDQLISLIHCKHCFCSADVIKKSKLGTSIHYKLYCENEHLIIDWKSQPLVGKMPAFNLLISASIFFFWVYIRNFQKTSRFFCTQLC